jgi:hypothetical protein
MIQRPNNQMALSSLPLNTSFEIDNPLDHSGEKFDPFFFSRSTDKCGTLQQPTQVLTGLVTKGLMSGNKKAHRVIVNERQIRITGLADNSVVRHEHFILIKIETAPVFLSCFSGIILNGDDKFNKLITQLYSQPGM